jgi:hypothetical protein
MHRASSIGVLNIMDLDSDETAIRPGYCRLARNVVRTRGKSEKGSAMRLTLGNKKAFNIGTVQAQNKRYRLYVPANTVVDVTLTVVSPDGSTNGPVYTIVSASGPAAVASQINAQGGTASSSGTLSSGGYVNIQYLGYQYLDYRIMASSTTVSGATYEYDLVCTHECIPTNLEGKLIPVASADLDGKSLYIISTSQRKRPTKLSLTVTGVSLNGPTTVLTLSGAHDMQVGEHVEIRKSNSAWLNATHLITSIGATSITIATAQIFLGSSIPSFTVGSEEIYRHPYGIGEIGVAEYNDDDDAWTYTRLIRSKEFNLNTLDTLDRPVAQRNNYRTSLYWTDGYNTPRALYIIGAQHSVDMCLGHVSSDGAYWYGNISEATQHILPQTRGYVDFVEQKQDGGNLTAGMKRYAIRTLNRFLVPCDWSTPTAQIPVYGPTTSLDNGGNQVIGSEAGDMTGKINVLRVDGVNRLVYSFVEIAVINYSGGQAPSAQIISRIPTRTYPVGQALLPQITYQHDGYETVTDLAMSELIDLSSDLFDTAKNSSVLDGRMIFSNLNKEEEDDLRSWAKTFRHRVMVKEIQESRDNVLTKEDDTDPNEVPIPRPQIGEYQLAENVFRYIGYMDNDTYRFGVMLRERATGRWTRVFHVDDISVDAYDTNIKANLAEQYRRDTTDAGVGIWLPNVGSTGYSQYFTRRKKDWALTAGPNSTATTTEAISAYTTTCKPMVSHVEFFGADMTTTVGGKTIRSKYDRIRFVRPDTVAKVLTTGYGVLGVAYPSMSQIMSSDLDRESSELVGPASTISLNAIKSKIAIYGQDFRTATEWPYFCGGMPIPSGPFFSQELLAPTALTTQIPNPPGGVTLAEFMEWAYPLNAYPGQGFGFTRMRGDGTWDEHVVGDPTTDWGFGNDWNFPNTRSAFVAFPNLVSFYSPDHLFGSVDPNAVKEGRYRMRVMAVNQEAVRSKVDAMASWGRAYGMMSEFHPRPSSVDFTDYGGNTFNILKSSDIPHGSYAQVVPFSYNLAGILGASGGAVIVQQNKQFGMRFNRSLAGYNLDNDFPNFPSEAEDNGGGDPHSGDSAYWQKITSGLWQNSKCMFFQFGKEPGEYPSFSTAYAHYGSMAGGASCLSFPPCPTDVFKDGGSGSTQTSTSQPWNGADILTYNQKRTNPIVSDCVIETSPGEYEIVRRAGGTGVFYAQLAREIDDPYGDAEQTIYRWICAEFQISESDTVIPQNVYSIFGGDTFTQGTYIKNRYVNEATRTLADGKDWDSGYPGSYTNEGIGSVARPGFGSGFKMFSQNRINSQMRYTTADQLIYLGDTNGRANWLEETDAKRDTFTYSDAYTPLFNIQQFAPYISTLPTRTQSPTRIQWSGRDIVDSLVDQYREVKPLSFKDLDLTKGEITAHYPVNGELVTWQRDSFDRQFFNTRGQLVTTDELNIVIGESDVMSRDGINMSIYGCQHRESIIRGRSDGGKDVVLWFNANTQQFIRFGADGTVVISERQPIASWLRENAKWVRDENSPHDTYGVRGVWDERYREAIWTFIGQRSRPEWQEAVNYSTGYAISYGQSGFNQLPDIYVCRRAHTSSSTNQIGVGSDWEDFWELVPHSNGDYYTEFTIAWSEIANGFSTFYGMMPSIYMRWRDAFLTPNPIERDSVYVHRVGAPGVWWSEDAGAGLVEDGYQELIHNEMPSEVKRYYAIQSSSDDAPFRVDFSNEDQETFLDESEWEYFDGMWRSPIKNDSTATGVNNGDTAQMTGRYMKAKVKIEAESENTIRELVVKTLHQPRSAGR